MRVIVGFRWNSLLAFPIASSPSVTLVGRCTGPKGSLKKRPPHAAVSPKSDEVFGSGGCESRLFLTLPASPNYEAHHAKPTGKKRQSRWPRRPGQAPLEQRIKEICQTRVRYGYRRVHVLLRREGWALGQNKTRRIYRELGLQLRNKTPKRRVKAKLRDDRRNATRPNETWAMDFVHDQLATGTKLRVLTIVDTISRFSPALEPRLSFRGTDVVEVLDRVGREVGLPATIRVDQGTEFVSRDLDLWAYQRGVMLDFSRPGKPTDNAFIEAFNGRFRAECLNTHWFLNLADAREMLEDWRKYYNEERPHGAIGQRTPIMLLNHVGAASPPP